MTTTLSAPRAPSRFQEFWKSRPVAKLRRNKLAVAGLFITLLFFLTAVFAPLIAKPAGNCLRDLNMTSANQVYNPLGAPFWKAIFVPPASCYQTQRDSFSPIPVPPNPGAYFGTSNGYDIFYGLVWGTRTMLKLGLVIVGITLITGMIIGSISGYYGGWLDNIIQRFIDILFSFPGIILNVVLITILGRSIGTIILAFTVTGWAGYARLIRGEVLRTRKLEYVDGARSLGANDLRMISKHVIPNSITPLLTTAILDLGTIPLSIAALSFLGIGLPDGYTDWGQIMNYARSWLDGPYWYVTVFPAAFIILFSLGWNLFGDAVRDAFDPRTR
ncbi:ABC transporter permease [Deinococcus altitudinis]|uniref:ABC transporter permease n=1 Tax=Deinococcus altitudinis TaxID=468914 RepID=UPI0038911DDC